MATHSTSLGAGSPNKPPSIRRARTEFACEGCRMRKVKCDGLKPMCSGCSIRGETCTYIQRDQRRRRNTELAERLGHNPRGKLSRMELLRQRMNRMEQVLAHAGITESDVSNASITSRGHREDNDQLFAARNLVPEHRSLDELQIFATNPSEASIMGSQTPFSIFSLHGIRIIDRSLGNSRFSDLIGRLAFENLPKISGRRPTPLPEKGTIASCAKVFFTDINPIFTIFSEQIFMKRLEAYYEEEVPTRDVAWYAALNAMLALSACSINGIDFDQSHTFMWNVMQTMGELILTEPSLFTVGAMLGAAIYHMTFTEGRFALIFCSIAARMLINGGIVYSHTDHLTIGEDLEYRFLFWTCFTLDQNLSIRLGKSPILKEEDMNSAIPGDDFKADQHNLQYSNGLRTVNIFKERVHLALIQSRTCRELNSHYSLQRSREETFERMKLLDTGMREWRDALPLEAQPENAILFASMNKSPQQVQLLVMHLEYYQNLIFIHWKAICNVYKDKCDPSLFENVAIGTGAARASIGMLTFISLQSGNKMIERIAIHHLLPSVILLFINILYNPTQPSSRTDFSLIQEALKHSDSCRKNSNSDRLHLLISGLAEIAEETLSKPSMDPEHSTLIQTEADANASSASVLSQTQADDYDSMSSADQQFSELFLTNSYESEEIATIPMAEFDWPMPLSFTVDSWNMCDDPPGSNSIELG